MLPFTKLVSLSAVHSRAHPPTDSIHCCTMKRLGGCDCINPSAHASDGLFGSTISAPSDFDYLYPCQIRLRSYASWAQRRRIPMLCYVQNQKLDQADWGCAECFVTTCRVTLSQRCLASPLHDAIHGALQGVAEDLVDLEDGRLVATANDADPVNHTMSFCASVYLPQQTSSSVVHPQMIFVAETWAIYNSMPITSTGPPVSSSNHSYLT